MAIYEYLDRYVELNYNRELNEAENFIKAYFESHKDKIVIESHYYLASEILKYKSNIDSLKQDHLVHVTDNSIFTRIINSKFIDMIDKYLPRDVTSLTIPKDIFDSLNFSEFNNLEEITIDKKVDITKSFVDKLKQIPGLKKFNCPCELKAGDFPDSIFIKTWHTAKLFVDGITINRTGLIASDDNEYYTVICKKPYDRLEEILNNMDLTHPDKVTQIEIREKDDNSLFGSTINYYEMPDGTKLIRKISFDKIRSISEIIDTLNLFESKNIHIDNVTLKLENKDYDDLLLIKKIEKKYKCIITYEEAYDSTTLRDFIGMRETIKYYKSLIEEADLTDLEKIMFAYDLIKSYKYQEDEMDRGAPRELHSIVRDGKIVCLGYSRFFSQLLKELGIDSYSVAANGRAHQRNIIKVDDEEYGVNGLYIFDPTWDSAHGVVKVIDKDGKETIKQGSLVEDGDKIIKRYDDLVLYRYFLIPYEDYLKVFPDEKLPTSDNITYYSNNEVASNLNEIQPNKYSSTKVNFKLIVKLLSNVRLKMGYSKDETIKAIDDVVEIYEALKEDDKKAIVKR